MTPSNRQNLFNCSQGQNNISKFNTNFFFFFHTMKFISSVSLTVLIKARRNTQLNHMDATEAVP